MTKDYVDHYSTTSCFVVAYQDTNYRWHGSGFFARFNSKLYFITNNHCVGGEYYLQQFLRDSGYMPPEKNIPNFLRIRMYNESLNRTFSINLPLKNGYGKNSYVKFWDNDSDSSSILDVVAIPILGLDSLMASYPFFLRNEDLDTRLPLYPAGELSVVGFPFDWGFRNLYPIWKRATIASDPNFNAIGNSKFFIDATTRGGMSGSPVFFRGTSYNPGGTNIIMTSQPITILVGIYSAQIYNSELGLVTRLEKIFEKLSRL